MVTCSSCCIFWTSIGWSMASFWLSLHGILKLSSKSFSIINFYDCFSMWLFCFMSLSVWSSLCLLYLKDSRDVADLAIWVRYESTWCIWLELECTCKSSKPRFLLLCVKSMPPLMLLLRPRSARADASAFFKMQISLFGWD